MQSCIIPDDKYQELKISFTFEEIGKDQITIKALVANDTFVLELQPSEDLDFEYLKSSLISKNFKLTLVSPDIIKIKVGCTYFQFENVEKLSFNSLKLKVSELQNKLKEQSQKGNSLSMQLVELKDEFDFTTTKIADIGRLNSDINEDFKAKFEAITKQITLLIDANKKTGSDLIKMSKDQASFINQFVELKQKFVESEKEKQILKNQLNRMLNEIVKMKEKSQRAEKKVNKAHQQLEVLRINMKESVQKQRKQRIELNEEIMKKIKKLQDEKILIKNDPNPINPIPEDLVQRQENSQQNRSMNKKKSLSCYDWFFFIFVFLMILGIVAQQIKNNSEPDAFREMQVAKKLKWLDITRNFIRESMLGNQKDRKQILDKIYEIKTINVNPSLSYKDQRYLLKDLRRFLNLNHTNLAHASNQTLTKQRQQKIQLIRWVFSQRSYKFSSSDKGQIFFYLKSKYNFKPKLVSSHKSTHFLFQQLFFSLSIRQRFKGQLYSIQNWKNIQSIFIYYMKMSSVGLCLKNIVQNTQYLHKNYHQFGHGCYLLSVTNQSYSHSDPSQNNATAPFKYSSGDIIKIQSSSNHLQFLNEKTLQAFNLTLNLTSSEWKQARFAVELWGHGDSISIVDKKQM